jgi:prepilin-type N-terminal cleavage/methylation domain-containing protein
VNKDFCRAERKSNRALFFERTGTQTKRGFTLIELLIVIAIILILIAIALPNFLEAQIRAKVARVQADLRTIGTALESYLIDWRIYPNDSEDEFDENNHGLRQLTTPLQYLPELPFDVFVGGRAPQDGTPVYFEMGSTGFAPDALLSPVFQFEIARQPKVNAYALYSHGPNVIDDFDGEQDWPFGGPSAAVTTWSYSATNGTRSRGNIHRFGGEWRSGHWRLDGVPIAGVGFNYNPP